MTDHARILYSYLGQLTHGDLIAILNADKKCLQEALNGNNSSQINANAGFYAVVSNAVNNLPEWRINLINQTINEELEIKQ